MILIDAASLAASLQLADGLLVAELNRSLEQATRIAQQNAKATNRFRDRTGRLRGSIVERSKRSFTTFVQAGSSSVHYAGFIEYGTRFIHARRFMETASDVGERALVHFVHAGLSNVFG